MISLDKTFRLQYKMPTTQFPFTDKLGGITFYRHADSSVVFDLIKYRGRTIAPTRTGIYIDGVLYKNDKIDYDNVYYGILIGDVWYMEAIPMDDILQTTSMKWNVNLPIRVINGTGERAVDAVAGPYLFNTTTKEATQADANTTFQFGDYQLLPTLSSDVVTTKKLWIGNLEMAPQDPPVNELLPNLFRNIKEGTYSDTYEQDDKHKIRITLTHSTSHGWTGGSAQAQSATIGLTLEYTNDDQDPSFYATPIIISRNTNIVDTGGWVTSTIYFNTMFAITVGRHSRAETERIGWTTIGKDPSLLTTTTVPAFAQVIVNGRHIGQRQLVITDTTAHFQLPYSDYAGKNTGYNKFPYTRYQ